MSTPNQGAEPRGGTNAADQRAAEPDLPSDDAAVRRAPARPPRTSRLWRKVLRGLAADPDRVGDPVVGRWPTTRQMFLWDLAPFDVAPNADGVVLPEWSEPEWLMSYNSTNAPSALEAQRRETARRRESITATELKASRLLTPFVALLTGAVALTAFQLNAVDWHHVGPSTVALIGAVFGGLGSAFLLVGLNRALDADTRMGVAIYSTAELEMVNPKQALLREAEGASAAKFVQKNKANRILQARAAISRSLLLLVISGLCGAGWLLVRPSEPLTPAEQPTPPLATVTVTVSPNPAPTASATATQSSPVSPNPAPTASATATESSPAVSAGPTATRAP